MNLPFTRSQWQRVKLFRLLCLCGVFFTGSLRLAGEMPFHFPNPAGSSLATTTVSSIRGAASSGALVVMKVQLKSIQRTISTVEAVFEKIYWYEQPIRKMTLWLNLLKARKLYENLLERYRDTQAKLGLPVDL